MTDTVLDMTIVDELLELSDDGDPELLLDLIEMFLEDGPTKVRAVSEGLSSQDFEKLQQAAHSLKGSAGNLGAHDLQETCDQLQSVSQNHDLNKVRELANDLETHFTRARAALEALRQEYS